MSRLEKPTLSRTELTTLERQVASVTPGPRKKHSCAFFGCMIFLLLFLVVLGWGAWTAAASGLVRVPGISAMAYRTPAPVRVVRSSSELFEQELERQLNTAKGKDLTVVLREETLTASMQKELGAWENDWVAGAGAQIAVLDDALELFLPIKKGDTQNALVARVRLRAQDGAFAADVLEVRIGNTSLPNVIARRMVGAMLQNGLEQLNTTIRDTAILHEVRLEEGRLMLTGTLNI